MATVYSTRRPHFGLLLAAGSLCWLTFACSLFPLAGPSYSLLGPSAALAQPTPPAGPSASQQTPLASSEAPRPLDDSAQAEIERLLTQLDEPAFDTRSQALEALEQRVSINTWQSYLADRFQRALLATDTSFEVRSHLERLLRSLPAEVRGRVATEGSDDSIAPLADTIAPLIEKLNADQHADRDSAVRHLSALLDHEELIAAVWSQAKLSAANPHATASQRRLLAPLIERAHEAWLRSELPQSPMPRPSSAQIQGWIDDLSRADNLEALDLFERTKPEKELLDLIARDDTRAEVLELLSTKLASQTDSAIQDKLQYLIDFSKPAMAAEAWNNQANGTVQYLIIDVPQFNSFMEPPKATHFDRIDDNSAHCVSGNSLTPGDYPVRVGIPHPEAGRDAMFYLTNLPTPRSRLAYEYSLQRDERQRLAEITSRTLDYFLRRRAPLSEVEILMLAQLEPRAVSRFVGEYFAAVPDAQLRTSASGLNGQGSVYAGICLIMNRIGTHEALPALEKVARAGTLGKPEYQTRVNVAWVAILAIATRDAWEGIDPWLAGLIDEHIPLTTDPDLPPELGASAAGLLLDRHGVSVRPFGLVSAGETVTDAFQFYGYRFTSERDREDVRRWWQKQQNLAAAARESSLTGEQPGIRTRAFMPRSLEIQIER